MNETLKGLYERKSIRRFELRPVSDEMRRQIIDAALQAPTAGNQTLYTILEIDDPALKARLAETCDNQPFIAKAPLVLVFLADCRRWYEMYRIAGAKPRAPGVGDLMLAFSDALIAAQNSVVAAHALGLSSCYVGDILEQKEEHVKLLGLDPWVVPAAMVVYGHAAGARVQRQKPPRFLRQYVVQKNGYHVPDEAELREAMRLREGPGYGFEDEITKFCARKYMSDFALEMTRSVAEYIKSFTPFDK